MEHYTGADYLERWAAFFGGEVRCAPPAGVLPCDSTAFTLLAEMKQKGLSRRALAAGLKQDHSFVDKVLHGEKPWPKGLMERAQAWVAEQGQQVEQRRPPP